MSHQFLPLSWQVLAKYFYLFWLNSKQVQGNHKKIPFIDETMRRCVVFIVILLLHTLNHCYRQWCFISAIYLFMMMLFLGTSIWSGVREITLLFYREMPFIHVSFTEKKTKMVITLCTQNKYRKYSIVSVRDGVGTVTHIYAARHLLICL